MVKYQLQMIDRWDKYLSQSCWINFITLRWDVKSRSIDWVESTLRWVVKSIRIIWLNQDWVVIILRWDADFSCLDEMRLSIVIRLLNWLRTVWLSWDYLEMRCWPGIVWQSWGQFSVAADIYRDVAILRQKHQTHLSPTL